MERGIQKPDWDTSMFPASKSLDRNEKLFLCCFLCEVPARGTSVGKLKVLLAGSQIFALCCEGLVTCGSKLRYSNLSEPREQQLRTGLCACSITPVLKNSFLSFPSIIVILITLSPRLNRCLIFLLPLCLHQTSQAQLYKSRFTFEGHKTKDSNSNEDSVCW